MSVASALATRTRSERMNLQVLLVEDDPADLATYTRDLPDVFTRAGLEVTIHPASSFEEANRLVADPSRRFDLIVSDTFRGPHARGDAAVIEMVNLFRRGRFCPIVVFSASAQPASLKLGAFVVWADKTPRGGIEDAVDQILRTGIPQEARSLHDELDKFAGSYLWEFLEDRWGAIQASGYATPQSLRRIVRRRAALQLAELKSIEGAGATASDVHGPEFYVYPPIGPAPLRLGQVIRHKARRDEFRVVLTPHCFLIVQPGQTQPRAEYVRVVKTVSATNVIGEAKLKTARENKEKRDKMLRAWTTPPSHGDLGKPEGRYWYLPAFLEIPHLYCDFLQVDSLPYSELMNDYESLAALAPPYAESLQACWTAFDAAVGIPNLVPSSIASILNARA